MSKGFASSYRMGLLAIGLLVSFAGVGVRLVWLHVIDRDELLRSVAKVRSQLIREPARRGDILDKNGKILATTLSMYVVQVDPSWMRATDEPKWPQLAALLGRPLPDVRKILTTKFREPAPAAAAATATSSATGFAGLVFNLHLPGPTTASVATATPSATEAADALAAELAAADDDEPAAAGDDAVAPVKNGLVEIQWAKLADNISESTMNEIDRLGIKGVYGTRDDHRTYPHKQLAAHLVGFVNHRQVPITGIERYADFYLRGQDGWTEGERDGRSRELAQFRTRDVPRADGYSVMLTLDANVQDIVEQELVSIAHTYQPLKATIIVSDPRTGFILGMGNYPTFDPNEYNRIPKEEQGRMRNIAVADIYEPGSVFKIIPAAAALEERLVTPDTRFDCTLEQFTYENQVLSLPRDDHHFDHDLSVAEIISRSSNKGAAQLGMLLGKDRLYRYARMFGFGRALGFPVGGEVNGMLASPGDWHGIDITRIPMGQAVAGTALQMHEAMSVIASGGVLLRPLIVQEIIDPSGEILFRFGRTEIGRAVSENTARTMATLLMGVVSKEGTAPEAAIPGFEVAGKTGTAQKYVDGKPSNTHHVASFVGFFPASCPQIAISVIVDDADAHAPGGIAYGKLVAAPSFKRIGEQLISYRDIKTGAPVPPPGLLALEGGRR
jgi:cell division protein FtsI (penicillin-binding protein 3)